MNAKKWMALLLAFAMSLSLAACGAVAQPAAENANDADDVTVTVEDEYDDEYDAMFNPCVLSIDSFESETIPYYNRKPENKGEIEVWFINGDHQVPYISLDSMIHILTDAYQDYDTFEMTASQLTGDWNIIVLSRENGSSLQVDYDHNELVFSDIDAFTALPTAANGLDLIELTTNGTGGNTFIKHTGMFYKNPSPVTICLDDYGIPMVYQDGTGYLPLQLIADLMVSRLTKLLVYNGQAVLLAEDLDVPEEDESEDNEAQDSEKKPADGTQDEATAQGEETSAEKSEQTLTDIYFSAPSAPKSEMLRIFSYNELCLALDYSYGLQSEHEIHSFNHLFIQTGLSDLLMSDDALDTFSALSTLTLGYFADLHSGTKHISYMADLDEKQAADPNTGLDMTSVYYSQTGIYYSTAIYGQTRAKVYPNGCPAYEEVGDTAFITFDHFRMNNIRKIDHDYDYYAHEPTANLDDTFELIMYANEQIHRENSPIKNVVIDLTNNTGGEADTAACVVAWMLGSCNLSIEDTVSGGQSTVSYTFDANRDGTMDENDYLGFINYHLYCLISPCSFSCGNLVPAALASSHFVTLIGDSSTGGACCVYPMSTADGTLFQISGPYRINTMNNGIYYSVDQGVDPDYSIDKLEHLYDRDYLTDYIHNLA